MGCGVPQGKLGVSVMSKKRLLGTHTHTPTGDNNDDDNSGPLFSSYFTSLFSQLAFWGLIRQPVLTDADHHDDVMFTMIMRMI